MKQQAKAWISAAEKDLKLIKKILNDPELTGIAAFHAQQSIEKSLKALLEYHNIEIPRIHNLIILKSNIEKFIELNLDDEIIAKINDLYIDTR